MIQAQPSSIVISQKSEARNPIVNREIALKLSLEIYWFLGTVLVDDAKLILNKDIFSLNNTQLDETLNIQQTIMIYFQGV